MSETFILWKHLDREGHDACRLQGEADSWHLHGQSVFAHEALPASLSYGVAATPDWRTTGARVTGWIGHETIDIHVERTESGAWLLDGERQDVPADILDLDLGFTPATNLLPVRRLSLAIGSEASAPAAYFDLTARQLTVLEQSYRRLDTGRYAYSAPVFGYEATLEVASVGFVRSYPGLFEAATPLPGR